MDCKQEEVPITTPTRVKVWDGSYKLVLDAESSTSIEAGSHFKQTCGVKTPDFFARMRRGELLPMTDFRQIERNITLKEDRNYDLRQTGTQWRHYYDPYYATSLSDVFESDETLLETVFANAPDLGQFVQAAASKLYSRGWDALTFFGELGDTVRMFKNVGRKINALGQMRRNSFAKSNKLQRMRKVDQAFWDSWLESRYGWRPLVSDLKSLSEAVDNLGKKVQRLKERSGASISAFSERPDSLVWNGSTVRAYEYKSWTWTFSFRGSVVADMRPPTIQVNPVVTAWELVKFSFVIDWFVSIGDALQAISFDLFYPEYVAATGIYATCIITESYRWEPGSGFYLVAGDNPAVVTGEWIYTQRNPATIPYRPYIRLKFDPYKLVDLVGLARQFKWR